MKLFEENIEKIADAKKIALVGFPSSGKSSLFRLLTDFKDESSYESTYEIVPKNISFKNRNFQIYDLPGIYSINSTKLSEKISIDFLLNQKIDLIINVIDATLLTRGLKLTIELLEMGLPVVVVLNFEDEAKKHGLTLNKSRMEEILQIPCVIMNARYGKGLNQLVEIISNYNFSQVLHSTNFEYTFHIENYVKEIENFLIENNSKLIQKNSRYTAIKLLEDCNSFYKDKNEDLKKKINDIQIKIFNEHKKDAFETISYERHHIAMKIAEETASLTKKKNISFYDQMDKFSTHPIIGYFTLLTLLVLFFFVIFYVGSFLSSIIDPPLLFLGEFINPLKYAHPFIWNSINGAYQGLLGAIGIVLPYFLPLVFFTAILEETGYLSRIVLLLDNLMHKFGLHGKSVIPFMMGLGCSVPALYSTRMLENRRDRIITAILVPLVPCSARITVIFALASAFAGPIWAVVIFLYIMFVIAASGFVLSKILPESTGLIMEILPLRAPSFRLALTKTWTKVREFLGEALLFLIIGGIVLGWIEYFKISYFLDYIFSPLINGILNLPKELGSTLIFGFLRKELILVMANQALGVQTLNQLPLSISQVVTFIIFVSLYFPCLSTFIVLYKEFKLKVSLVSAIGSLVLAIFSALIFRALFWFV